MQFYRYVCSLHTCFEGRKIQNKKIQTMVTRASVYCNMGKMRIIICPKIKQHLILDTDFFLYESSLRYFYLQLKLLTIKGGSSIRHPKKLLMVSAMMRISRGLRSFFFSLNIQSNDELHAIPTRNTSTRSMPTNLSLRQSPGVTSFKERLGLISIFIYFV